jgi:hypothetical protein
MSAVEACWYPVRADNIPHMGRSGTRICRARSKTSGLPCQYPIVPGLAVCRFHGGNTPQARAKAARVLAEQKAAKVLGIPVDAEPTEALLHAVRVAAGDVVTLATLVNQEPDLLSLYERALDRMARISKMALDGGAAERQVRMAESQAADMMRVLQAGMDALGVTRLTPILRPALTRERPHPRGAQHRGSGRPARSQRRLHDPQALRTHGRRRPRRGPHTAC